MNILPKLLRSAAALFAAGVLAAGCGGNQQQQTAAGGGHSEPSHDTRSIRHRIADAYGIHAFPQVEELRYTFNVSAGDRSVRRTWRWWPKQDSVEYVGGSAKTEPLAYSRVGIDTASDDVRKIDQAFINDEYWLTFPFHLEWDQKSQVTVEGQTPLPLGDGKALKVVVHYPKSAGGYTPGDTYDLYIGDDNRIVQWTYHSGADSTRSTSCTWEGDMPFRGITLPTDHLGPNGSFRLWFSDVDVVFSSDKRE